ncbi:MAG: FeoA domain-containing protein [Planctomycetia bacterium]|nr:FeoA domain-containing protein [Planctomycetia bacterium]
MHDLIPLSQVAVGRRGEIGAVLGLPDSVHRLEELGIRVGATVEMIQTGAPCIIKLAEQRLCFRSDELFSVLVRTEEAK